MEEAWIDDDEDELPSLEDEERAQREIASSTTVASARWTRRVEADDEDEDEESETEAFSGVSGRGPGTN